MSPHFLKKYIYILTAVIAYQSVEATKRSYEDISPSSSEERPVKK